MPNRRWDMITSRIKHEAKWRGGRTNGAFTKIHISVVMRSDEPVVWEVLNSTKIEPTNGIIEDFVGISEILRQLNKKCGDAKRLRQVLQEVVSKL